MPVLWQPAAAGRAPIPIALAIVVLQGSLKIALALLHAHVVQRLLVHARVLQRQVHIAQPQGARVLRLQNPGSCLVSIQG